jgi:8-oxo-dGTP diphosphatase
LEVQDVDARMPRMPVILIRHAQAGLRRDWVGDDRLRPLSTRGRRQADRLPESLRSCLPQRVLSSPYTRCVQTVTPLAGGLGLRTETTEHLAEGAGLQALVLIRSLADDKVAVCTHGDVITDILVALADEDRLDLGPKPRQAKGSAWVLQADLGRFVRAAYLAPPR